MCYPEAHGAFTSLACLLPFYLAGYSSDSALPPSILTAPKILPSYQSINQLVINNDSNTVYRRMIPQHLSPGRICHTTGQNTHTYKVSKSKKWSHCERPTENIRIWHKLKNKDSQQTRSRKNKSNKGRLESPQLISQSRVGDSMLRLGSIFVDQCNRQEKEVNVIKIKKEHTGLASSADRGFAIEPWVPSLGPTW